MKRNARKLEEAPKNAKTGRSRRGEKAGPEKLKQISRRAGELAMNQGKRPAEAEKGHVRRAKRELLGLQTLPNPDNPLDSKKS